MKNAISYDDAKLKKFDEFRNQLLTLVGTAIHDVTDIQEDGDFSDYGKGILDRLLYSQRILDQNILPASLFAAFQTGKSTTTVAMADGHEITPCGKGGGGIRVSAIPMTIYSDKYSTEVRINLYSDIMLLGKIINVAGSHLDSQNPEDFDLHNPESIKVLTEAVKEEITIYQNSSPESYNFNRINEIRSAILILTFYGCKEYLALQNEKYKTISDIQPFISFAPDLERKWKGLREKGWDVIRSLNEDGTLSFTAVESLHVFIESVVVPVHSEFMEETGTAVIDAPGTMASTEDTERALKAAAEAAVVLFILSGERQLSESDKEMLKKLKAGGMADKVVFVINFRINPEVIQAENGVSEVLLNEINQAGYNMEHHKKFLYYNAYLAVRAAQGTLMMKRTLDSLTERAICEDADKRKINYQTIEEAWKKTTIKVLRMIDEDNTADLLLEKGLCEQTIEAISTASHWREMITDLRVHVMKNRVVGILRDLGATPIKKALTEMEQILLRKEQAMERDEAEAKAQYERAKAILSKFAKETETLINEELDSEIDRAIAENYYDEVLFKSTKSAAEEAAPKVFAQTELSSQLIQGKKHIVRVAKNAGRWFKNEFTWKPHAKYESAPPKISQLCQNIIKDCYRESVAQSASKWSLNLEKSSVYDRHVKKSVLQVKSAMIRIWNELKNELKLPENDMLSQIESVPKDITGFMSRDIVNAEIRNVYMDYGNLAQSIVMNGVLAASLSSVSVVSGLGFIYMYILPMDFIIPFFAEIVMVIGAVVGAIVYALMKEKKEKRIEKLSDEITSNILKAITSDKKTIIQNIMGNSNDPDQNGGTMFIRKFYETLFRAVLTKQRQSLQAIYDSEMKNLKMSQEERKRIAQKANMLRTEQIEPLRQKVDDVLAQIKKTWPLD